MWIFLLELMWCLVLCRGIFIIKVLDLVRNCVGYDISFKFNKLLIVKLKDFYCEILGCLLEVVEFVCMFNGEFVDIFFNMILSNENRECFGNLKFLNVLYYKYYKLFGFKWLNVLIFIDFGISIVINLSCLIGGSLIGISIFVLVKCLRIYK